MVAPCRPGPPPASSVTARRPPHRLGIGTRSARVAPPAALLQLQQHSRGTTGAAAAAVAGAVGEAEKEEELSRVVGRRRDAAKRALVAQMSASCCRNRRRCCPLPCPPLDDARENPAEGRLRWCDDATGAIKSKAMLAAELDALAARTLAVAPDGDAAARMAALGAVLGEISRLVPTFASIFEQIRLVGAALVDELLGERAALRRQAASAREAAARDRDAMYEDKITELVVHNRALQRSVATLEGRLEEMRRARDLELNEAKREVCVAVRKCVDDEAEQRGMRELVNAVFRTNEELRARIELLESGAIVAAQEVPSAPATAASRAACPSPTTAGAAAASGHASAQGTPALASPLGLKLVPRRLHQQVPVEFIEASKREMEAARLSTQKILVQCASESQSSFRLLLEREKEKTEVLKEQNEELRRQLTGLEAALHARRFGDWSSSSSSSSSSSPASDSDRPRLEDAEHPKAIRAAERRAARLQRRLDAGRLTPRPAIPLAVQTRLGVNLQRSSRRIVRELASVSLTQHADLNGLLTRFRTLTATASWVDDCGVRHLLGNESNFEGEGPLFLRPEPRAAWPRIAHFRRTLVEDEVPCHQWTAIETARVIRSFLEGFDGFLHEARRLHDEKTCAPLVVRLWDRVAALPVRFDATLSEMRQSVANVPMGYVVSQFIEHSLRAARHARGTGGRWHGATAATAAETSAGGDKSPRSPSSALDAVRAVVEMRVRPGVAVDVLERVELEFATFAANLWHSARRFRHREPLCELFLQLLDGRVPIGVFATMGHALRRLRDALAAQDTIKTRTLRHRQIVSAAFAVFADKPGSVWRELAFSIVDSMNSCGVPLQEKIALDDLLASETHPQGSSTLTRFVRFHILSLFGALYDLIEEALTPLVFESMLKPGLMLLHAEVAMDAVRTLQRSVAPRVSVATQAGPATEEEPEGGVMATAVMAPQSPREAPDDGIIPDAPEERLVMPRRTATDRIRARRAAAPQVDFVSLLASVLGTVPRLNASVHCRSSDGDPHTARDDGSDGGGGERGAGSEGKAPRHSPHRSSSSSGKGKGRGGSSRGVSATRTIVESVSDQRLVEWYALMQNIRLIPPGAFYDKLCHPHQEEADVPGSTTVDKDPSNAHRNDELGAHL